MNRRRIFAAAMLAAAGLAGQLAVMPTAAAAPCSDIDVTFARGTHDTAGLGEVGTAFVNSLRAQVGGRTVTTYAVNYPASYDFLASGDGAVDANSHIVSMAQTCPATKLVLGGYSQGAAVVDFLTGVPVLGTNLGTPLPATVANNVVAVAVFGNPSTKMGKPISSASSLYAGKAIDLCKDGDPICSSGRNPFAHNDYVSAGLTNQAAGFVAGRL